MTDEPKTPMADKFASAIDGIKAQVSELGTMASGLSVQAEMGRALVGGAIAENMLTWVIKSGIRPLSKIRTDRLFSGNAPLSSFSAKIDIAHAFKLIDDDLRKDLHVIREIRNAFAHVERFAHFKSQRIGKLCQKFDAWENGCDNYTLYVERIRSCCHRMRGHIDPKFYSDIVKDWAPNDA